MKVYIKEQGPRIAKTLLKNKLGILLYQKHIKKLLHDWHPLERQIDQRKQIKCLETDPNTCRNFRHRWSLGKGWTILNDVKATGDSLENK